MKLRHVSRPSTSPRTLTNWPGRCERNLSGRIIQPERFDVGRFLDHLENLSVRARGSPAWQPSVGVPIVA